jgi:hypothetical protein
LITSIAIAASIIAAIVSPSRMVAMAEFLAQLMLALLQTVAELLSYFTSKFLLPLFTRGRVVVMPYGSLGTSRWFIPCRRFPNGTICVDGDFAILIALIFWTVVIVGSVLMLHARSG